MNKYLENIQSMDSIGTSIREQIIPESTPILEMSGDAPKTTYAELPTFSEEISQDTISYSAPQKVIVRKYRLRK